MSLVSQTQPRRAGFARWFALSILIVAVVVGAAMGPYWTVVADVAGRPRLHPPDWSLLAGLSLPIKIHLATALAALVLGAVLMVVRKGRTFHRLAGWTWVSLVSVTAGATLFITSLNHGSWSLLHLLTGWVLIGLPLAVIAARRHAIRQHRRQMMGLFYGGFAINVFIALLPGRALWMTFFG